MDILFKGENLIEDVVITSAAEHEEELMKSDFVKLSWDDSVCRTLPVGAYIMVGDIPFSLLKPYTPEQKSDIQWRYEPQFQHPKMYLGCVTFQNPVTDDLDNDVDLIDWPYTGLLKPLLGYFCSAIEKALGFPDGTFIAIIIDEKNIESIVSAQFNVQDILSALTNVANTLDCEWHIDWNRKVLYFGHISYVSDDNVIPVLKVGENIQMSSRRDSKDKYFNVIQPQGSTRNLSRVAISGENVQATIRLALDENTPYHINDEDYPDGVTTPGRKIFTDGNGKVISKAAFDAIGEKEFFKSVVFEEIYPRQDAYIYNVRYRERYLLDENGKKIEETRNAQTGVVTYKRYAIWYMRIGIPTGYDTAGNVTGWKDYRISQEGICVVRDRWQTMGYPDNQYNRIVIKTNLNASASYFKTLIEDSTGLWQVNYDLVIIELNGIKVYARWHTEWEGDSGTITLTVDARDNCVWDDFKGDDRVYDVVACITYGVYEGKCKLWDESFDWDRDKWYQFLMACNQNEVIVFRGGVVLDNFPTKNKRGNIIDGKEPIAAFQTNTKENALYSSLSGRGKGDGDGHYGFKLKFLDGLSNDGAEYIKDANISPTEDGDTGIVDMDGNRATVGDGDFEIIKEDGDYILPSTVSLGIIPRGGNTPALTNNKVNIYNVVLDGSFEEAAKAELAQEAAKYAKKECEDNTNYSFRTDQLSFYNNDPGLFIGRTVTFVDGGGNVLNTRIIKLVTKLDFSFEKEITVGNAVIKSNTSQLQDKVDAIVTGGAQGGGEGGGVNAAVVNRLIEEYATTKFLSKVHEDVAQEAIQFVKGLWVGAEGSYGIDKEGAATVKTIDGNEATFLDRVTTNETVTDFARSSNFTGWGLADTGWGIHNSINGHSKLTIDEIYVRMRAIFESLEVRERTYTGGDQIWSCAGNYVVRTDYLSNATNGGQEVMMEVYADGSPASPQDEDYNTKQHFSVPVAGDTIGYSTLKQPFAINGKALKAGLYLYGKNKTARTSMTMPSQSDTPAGGNPVFNIRRVRCYFLAKDGEREVRNWWRINDLARCQTMNLQNVKRKTYIGDGQKAGNIFWWRKVIGVSVDPVTLDDGKEYHYFDVAYNHDIEQSNDPAKRATMATFAMDGSDIPAAGDSVVQFGNTVIEGRMNLMMMEVNGSDAIGYNPSNDAPCLKAYRGIYCFDLNKCWIGGSTLKMKLSPKTGYEFYGPNFKIVTEYDVAPVPMDRGLFTNICRVKNDQGQYLDNWQFEKDDYGRTISYSDDSITHKPANRVRKCYYYDKVSHNGSYWLCSIVDGAHWVDVNGNYISDAEYSVLPDDQKPLCTRKQNYTIEEPSENSIDWTMVVSRGDDGVAGDTPISVFKWNDSATQAPSITGTSYPPSGWYKTPPTKPTGMKYLWMSNSVKHYNGTIDNWSIPVRISGDDGNAGEDASDREFIYIRLTTYPFSGTAPRNISRGKVHGQGEWVSRDDQYDIDGYVPEGWSDTALPATESEKYVYAAMRLKPSGYGESWENFGEPFLWSNWGVQGIDGDGVQYVYKLFNHELTDAEKTSNIPAKPASMTDGEWIPTGWSDNPLAPTQSTPYCYCSIIKKVGGSWADAFETLGLWSRWSKDGGTYENRYQWNQSDTTAPTFSPNAQNPGNNWKTTVPTRPAAGYFLWAISAVHNADGTYGTWGNAIRLTGDTGSPGEDASDVEWIYKYDNSGFDGSKGEVNPSAAASGNVTNKNQNGWVPNGWYDHALGISADHVILYASFRKKDAGNGETWGAFQEPIEWSHWGRNGMDGDGVEYVYARTTTNTPPTITNDTYNNTEANYNHDDFLPHVTGASTSSATDDPVGTDATYQYEWCIKRTKDAPDSTGVRKWKKYTGTMSLWANFSKSITKKSESNAYAVTDANADHPTADSSDWKTTKAAAITAYNTAHSISGSDLAQNAILWTKTDITWSDGSHTILYSGERNPNDGVPGQSVTITSQSVTYSKQTSGSLDPESLTYGAYPTSLSKGDWLYSKTTVNYSDNTHTDTYGITYIGTDGAAGRGVSAITEYYAASASKDTAPAISDFSTSIPNDWNETKRYLWNYEKTAYTKAPLEESTTPSVIATWTENGKGIDSIVNYYVATSKSSGVTRNSNPSDGTWTTSIQAISETKPYLWNYEKITWIEKDGSNTYTYTDAHIIGHFGKDGKSITKQSESYRYATNNTGTRPAASSSDWSTTKPTLQKGYWLFTETTITWSDNSTTVLYTDERNPNDGAVGQDIIVDGATTMKYYVGNSNTTHPADDSSDWKDLSQVTQTQGMWLWSQAKTWYRKANSAAGAHDAGSSIVYNVSYIAEDGEPARGIESITEYYKASTLDGSDAQHSETAPNNDSGWSTDPNLSDLTNKWGQTYKYLWNYEKVVYSKAPLVERTTPQIVAIWTKDGAPGKGIDSIVNKYKVTNSTTAPLRAHEGGTGWSDTPVTPGHGEYLWNYEIITWVNPSSTTYTDVQMIGYNGTNGTNSVVLDMDNQHEDFLYNDAGTNISGTVTVNCTLHDGDTPVDPANVGWSIDATQSSGVSISSTSTRISNGVLTIPDITQNTAKVVVKAKYPNTSSGKFYYATFTANKNRQDKYDIKLGKNAISYNPSDYTTQTISIGASRMDLTGAKTSIGFGNSNDKSKISNTRNKGYLRVFAEYSSGRPAQLTRTQVMSTPFSVTATMCLQNTEINFELRRYDDNSVSDTSGTGGVLVDYESVPIAKVANGNGGEPAFTLDLDNMMDSFGADSNSAVTGQQIRSTNVYLYSGTIKQTITALTATLYDFDDNQITDTNIAEVSATFSGTTGNVEVTIKNGAVITSEGLKVEISATCGKGTKETAFNISKVKSGEPGVSPTIYQLYPTVNELIFSYNASNTLVADVNATTIKAKKYIGSSVSVISTTQTDLFYRYGFDNFGASATDQNIGTTITVTTAQATSYKQVWIELYTKVNNVTTVVDRDVIPILKSGKNGGKGDNGDNGISVITDPSNIIIRQVAKPSGNNTTDFGLPMYVGFEVREGGTSGTIDSVTVPAVGSGVTARQNPSNTKQIEIQNVVTSQGAYPTTGYFYALVNYTIDRESKQVSIKVPVYIDLIGSIVTKIEGDVETTVATDLGFKEEGSDVYSITAAGKFIRSSREFSSVLSEKIDNGKNLFTGALTGNGWKTGSNTVDVTLDDNGWFIANGVGGNSFKSPSFNVTEGQTITLSFSASVYTSITVVFHRGSSSSTSGTSYIVSSQRHKKSYTPQSSGSCYVVINAEKIYHPQIEIGSEATEFDANIKESESYIKQTASSIDLGVRDDLADVGIHIQAGDDPKVAVKGGKFEMHDNSGNKTFELDTNGNLKSNGDAYFEGTIRASVFYRGICNFMQGGAYSDESGEKYAICTNLYNMESEYTQFFSVGKYYSNTYITQKTNDYYNYDSSFFMKCSYKADIIYMMPTTDNWTSGTIRVNLPHPKDFLGKVVEVFAFQYGVTTRQVEVGAVGNPSLEYVHQNANFSKGTLMVDNGEITVVEGSNLSSYVTITTDTRALFYAMGAKVSGVGFRYFWKLMSQTNYS